METFKRVQRRLLRLSWMSPLRNFLWTQDARRDSRATKKFSFDSGLEVADIFDESVFSNPNKQALFILGSGSSVNEMSPEQFDHISEYDSVGINFWFFHEFVPNVFSFDSGKVEESHQEEGRSSQSQFARVFHTPELLCRLPRIIFLRPHAGDKGFLFPVSDELMQRALVTGRANLVGQGPSALRADLKVLLKRLRQRSLPQGVLPDNGSSVVRLIFLALAQGYRQIVLCGVDLDSRPHFWMNETYAKRYPEHVNLFPAPDGEIHGTAEANGRPLGNLEFLVLLDKVMQQEKMGQLFVGSPSSRLSSHLKPYVWPESKE